MDPAKADAILGIVMEEEDETGTDLVSVNAPSVPATTTHSIAQVDKTLDFAKDNMKKAIADMADLVQDATLLAKQTGISDQYSAASSLFATFIQANKALVDVETKQHAIHKKEAAGVAAEGGTVHNTQINNHFHGTTEDFLEQLRKLKANGIEAVQEND